MPNADVLSRAGIPSMYTLLSYRSLRGLLGHVGHMEDDRIPNNILYITSLQWRRTLNEQHLTTGGDKLLTAAYKRDKQIHYSGEDIIVSLDFNSLLYNHSLLMHSCMPLDYQVKLRCMASIANYYAFCLTF